MDENPYQSPQEKGSQPKVKAGMAIGLLMGLSIPAGCICGGITCWTSGVVGELTVEKVGGPIDAGFLVGIPIGLLVVILVPLLAFRFFGKHETWRQPPQRARQGELRSSEL